MIKLFVFFLSLFLIFIIFLRVPQESAGLSSFASKSDFFGSPRSTEKFLNILTGVCIVIYLALAIKLNLSEFYN